MRLKASISYDLETQGPTGHHGGEGMSSRPKGRGLEISAQSNTFSTWDTSADFIFAIEVYIAL